MKNESIEEYVFKLTKTVLPGNGGRTITRDLDLVEDLNADSLSIVSMFYSCGEQFGIETDDLGSFMGETRTVGDLIEAIRRLKGAGR